MVIKQTVIFALSAVIFKALIGFVVAHFVHNLPAKGQRKWRGMLLVPWVTPRPMGTLAWFWLFDPSYSAFNWVLTRVGLDAVPWLGEPLWARFSVILVNVWYGAPFFLIMYLAALKSVPEQLYEAAAIDGANWWQKIWYITLPMMRHIIALTPPLYMFITSLKTSAEISSAKLPWWVFDPTLDNYSALLTSPAYLTFFRNSAVVSVAVVAITMAISIPAAFSLSRMRFWGSGALAAGVFLTYLIPETLLFIPLFKIF